MATPSSDTALFGKLCVQSDTMPRYTPPVESFCLQYGRVGGTTIRPTEDSTSDGRPPLKIPAEEAEGLRTCPRRCPLKRLQLGQLERNVEHIGNTANDCHAEDTANREGDAHAQMISMAWAPQLAARKAVAPPIQYVPSRGSRRVRGLGASMQVHVKFST